MKDKIMGFFVNYFAKKPWAFFSGKKSYLGGAGMILLGAAQILASAAAANSPADLLALAQALPDGEALKLILAGLSIVGIRHAQSKTSEDKPQP